MTGFEYRVLTQRDRYFGGTFDPLKLEKALNAFAVEGWRVVAVTSASVAHIGTNRDEMIIIFERPV